MRRKAVIHNSQATKRADVQVRESKVERSDFQFEEDDSQDGGDLLDEMKEDALGLADFPLLVVGANNRDQLGIGNELNRIVEPQPVLDFNKSVRIGHVSTGMNRTLVTNQTSGELFLCCEETKGKFEKVDTNELIVLETTSTTRNGYFLTGSRQVYSFGMDERYGQLGRDPNATVEANRNQVVGRARTTSRNKKREDTGFRISFGPVDKLLTTRIKQISAGRFHVIALSNAGIVYSWGRNNMGQLGMGDYINRKAPCIVDALNGCHCVYISASSEFSVACGDSKFARHICRNVDAMEKKRVVFSWGLATHGRLGHSRVDGDSHDLDSHPHEELNETQRERKNMLHPGNQVPNVPVRSLPTPIPSLMEVEKGIGKIATGEAHVIALSGLGVVFAWGENIYGQLGLGHTYEEVVPVRISTLSNIADIACGARHSAFLNTQGVLLSCGFNSCGELGVGDEAMRNAPAPVLTLAKANVKLSGVACGYNQTVCWSRIAAQENELCFHDDFRQRQCVYPTEGLDENVQPNMSIVRSAEADGYAYIAMAGPMVAKGSHTWNVYVNRIASDDSPIGIGVAGPSSMEPYMFDLFDQGSSWLFMSNGEKLYMGDAESYSEPFYERDTIEVMLDMDLGILRFKRRGRDLGLCYYVSSSEPLMLCVSFPSEKDQVTLLPEQEDEKHALVDPSLEVCFNDEGLHVTTGTEVFYRCWPCNQSICRACARKCKHRLHRCELQINQHPKTQLCECDNLTCQCKHL